MKQLVLIAALVALPLAANAGPKEKAAAQKHIEKATVAHEGGNFAAALTELEAAYALDAQPDLLYAIGQVHVKMNNCPVAISFYERYLETKPAAEPAAATSEAISNCRELLAAQPPPPEVTPEPVVAPPPPPPEAKKFDPIGATFVGVGVVSTIVGVVFYTSATGALDDAEATASYMEHDELVESARSKRTLAVVFGVAGVAAIGVGAWHYLSFRKKEQARVTVTPSTSGGMVMWTGRF